MPAEKEDLPSSLARSAQKVQDAYLKSLESAEEAPGGDGGSGGIDTTRTKAELLEEAREADIAGRSKMDKDELIEALESHSRRETDRARG